MRPRSWKAWMMLGTLCLGMGVLAEAEDRPEDGPFRVRQVRLNVEERTRPFDLLLPERVEQIVSAKRFVAFRSGRGVWVKLPGKPLRPLDAIVDLPAGFDWYQHACAAGDRLVVSVSRYSEEQRLREEQSDLGDFRAGPEAAGYLVVDLRKPRVTYLDGLKVTARPSGEGAEQVTLGMQSCVWDGRRLYVGDFGALARVDLEEGSVEILEEDELGVNRMSLVKDGDELWYAAFADWPSVERWTPRGARSFSLLNQDMLEPDTLLAHRGRLLASSPAGIVEIDEPKRSYIQYRLSDDPETLGIYGLTLQHRKLLGARDDGWVELDLRSRKATHYRLAGPGADNRVLAIGWFDGDWYLGTGSGLVRVVA